jgi:hypothetical protein
MAQKKGNMGVSATQPTADGSMQNLDYRLPNLSGNFGNSGGGSRSTGPRISPTTISQPSSSMAAMAGQGPPKGYGFKVTRKFKKGGFAVKPVWDKKRPKDLGEPKDLSVKRKKSAKARAKAAGRPYPNLIDNMAAARKKGK